jgi:hypothetical protein
MRHSKPFPIISAKMNELLSCVFNQILYTRNLYPKSNFVKKNMYNCPVWISQNKLINDYIYEITSAIIENIDRVNSIEFLILSESQVVEKYSIRKQGVLAENDFDLNFTALLSKLNYHSSSLDPLPDDSHYTICVDLESHDGSCSWILAQEYEFPDSFVTPIHTCNMGDGRLELVCYSL